MTPTLTTVFTMKCGSSAAHHRGVLQKFVAIAHMFLLVIIIITTSFDNELSDDSDIQTLQLNNNNNY